METMQTTNPRVDRVVARQRRMEIPCQKALDEFMRNTIAIRERLEEIRDAADAHFDLSDAEIHWGHVGDTARTLEALNEIISRIRGEVK